MTALNEALTAEVQRLKIATAELSGESANNKFQQLSINPQMYQLHQQQQSTQLNMHHLQQQQQQSQQQQQQQQNGSANTKNESNQ